MSSILICWELGSGLGQITQIQQVIDHYQDKGHTIWLAARDTSVIRPLITNPAINLIAAPFADSNHQVENGRGAVTGYANLLQRSGYYRDDALNGLVEAWQNLITLIRPELLIINHSPTAVLASRNLKIATVAVGSSFSIPADSSPLAVFSRNHDAKEKALAQERQVLRTINTVCLKQKIKPLHSLADMFETVEHIVFQNHCELDHYGQRSNQQARRISYVSSQPPAFSQPAIFPHYEGPKIFCYLKATTELATILQALKMIRCSAIVVCPGLSEIAQHKYRAKHIIFHQSPVNMQEALLKSDIAITHAGESIVNQFLQQGKPVCVLPMSVDQLMVSRKIKELNAGAVLNTSTVETAIESIQRSYSRSAQDSARLFYYKYQDFKAGDALQKELDYIENRYL